MLSKIYIEVKQLMDEGLAEKMAINSTLKEKTFQSVQHFAQQFMAYPLEANFMWAIQANPEFVSSKAMEESLQFVAPLLKLQKELLDAKVLKEENLELVIPLLFSPITAFIDEKNRNRQPIAIRDLNRIITLSVDAVFIE